MSVNNFKRKDKYKLQVFILSFLTLAFFVRASGQQPERKTASKEVLLNVIVGVNGGFITGLSSDNFSIYDENKLRTITKFSREDAPVSIGILYDLSTSPKVRSKLIEADEANPIILKGLRRFVELSNSSNEYFFLTFNETQNLSSDFTQDSKSVFKTIDEAESIKAKGGSNVYDAIWQGTEKLSKGRHSKKVLLVLTDGIDSNSKIKLEELENKLKNSDILLFVFSLHKTFSGVLGNISQTTELDELADQTGGSFYYTNWNLQTKGSRVENLTRATFASLANELRSQYTISFESDEAGNKPNSFWRDIKIKVKIPSGVKGVENIQVRTRKGYYSNSK